ncbi:MAG: cupin domain-containing protein [Bryobacteraceae bacterium]|nr:cupin domain-containing protein [Bryobacteraceae bacterium]
MNHDELRELAVLYALGALDNDEAAPIKAHLAAGCRECAQEVTSLRDTAALLAHGVEETAPPERLRDRVLRSARASRPGLHIVEARSEGWVSTGFDGVMMKRLYYDRVQETVTVLLRMEPGAVYPGHRHGSVEQCFVLEGDVQFGGLEFRAGDFMAAPADSIHAPSTTRAGCTMLIISSTHNEML